MILKYLLNKISYHIEAIKFILFIIVTTLTILLGLFIINKFGNLEKFLIYTLWSIFILFIIGEVYNGINYIVNDYKKYRG